MVIGEAMRVFVRDYAKRVGNNSGVSGDLVLIKKTGA
jgi:hypothetical protein